MAPIGGALLLTLLCIPAARARPLSRPLTPAGPAPVAVVPASQPASAEGELPISNDLEELRRFEEKAFPRPGAAGPAPAEPPLPVARPSAESPPAPLRSGEHGRQTEPPANRAPGGWLAGLALPDLPIRWDAKLIRYLEFYRSSPGGRAIMSTWLRRLGRYRKLIADTLHRHGLPQGLIHVAMIESGFNPRVTSSAGAAGLWQFMAGPGEGYGLARDHWVDERRNPQKSSEAAARYLKDLHQRFGTWELALAAYNAGHGNVIRSIQKYNTNDYWQLCRYEAGLPWETALYVPKILAAAIVAANRTTFGFDQISPEPEVPVTLVAVSTSITLAQAAAAAGVEKDLLEQLNPELQRGRTPPGAKVWLRIPSEAESRFYKGLAARKGELGRYKPYLVRLGERLAEVAEAHGTSVAALRSLNGLESSADLRPGLTILVPAARATPGKSPSSRGEVEPAPEPALVPIPVDRPRALPGRRRVFYRTVPGDRLDEIARHLGVSVAQLTSWNSLDREARLVSGMVLQVFVGAGFDASKVVLVDPRRLKLMAAGSEEFYSAYEERKGRQRIVYLVRDGDTLGAIGKRYKVSLGDLMRINQLGRQAKLQIGQKLILYVDQAMLRPKPPKQKPGQPPAVAETALPAVAVGAAASEALEESGEAGTTAAVGDEAGDPDRASPPAGSLEQGRSRESSGGPASTSELETPPPPGQAGKPAGDGTEGGDPDPDEA